MIDNSTVTAKTGGWAFDVCRYASYPSVSVEVKGNSQINGNIELSASGNNAKDGMALTLTSGKLTGEIVVDASATKALEAATDKVTVTRKDAFQDENTPAGYDWIENKLTKVYVVTFVTGEGASEAPAVQTIAIGEKAAKPATDPTKEGYNFKGWFAPNAIEAFNFETAIKADITLTAKWEAEHAVAQIGTTTYATLADAVAAAQGGQTIDLLDDIELPAKLTITDDKTITLNFNGHNIDTTATKYIENNGDLTLTDSSTSEDSGITASRYGIYNKGTLTIDTGAKINSGRYGVYQIGANATTNLNAGTITGTQAAVYAVSGSVTAPAGSNAKLLGNVNDVVGANKSLSGGYYSKKVLASYIAEGYTCTTEPADNGLYQIVGAIGVTFKANLEGAEFTAQTGLNANGTTATMSGAEGETITLPTVSKTNSVFLGWKYGDNVLAYGSSFELPANVVEMTGLWLTAVDTAYASAKTGADAFVDAHYNKHSNGQNIDADDTFYFYVKVVDGPVGEVTSITLKKMAAGM